MKYASFVPMNNNDIFRRLRFILNYNDSEMQRMFALADCTVEGSKIAHWLNKNTPEEDDMSDFHLAAFLTGVIHEKRGKREGPQPPIELTLNNNIIFRKLRIAFNLKDTDILHMIDLAGMRFSKHELSAFFRKPTQSQYRECQDQILRKFLKGLQLVQRGEKRDERRHS